ncbi:uncharacterized protein LOC142330811 [Lycorma delicatula]|uniref:uncharacterized protein LOC142330811 n=1 Tax=Lycorma delicatula TaxID=130591 RepID=UPI003F517B81
MILKNFYFITIFLHFLIFLSALEDAEDSTSKNVSITDGISEELHDRSLSKEPLRASVNDKSSEKNKSSSNAKLAYMKLKIQRSAPLHVSSSAKGKKVNVVF